MFGLLKRCFLTAVALVSAVNLLAAPGRADLTMSYELTGEKGKVVGVVVAPLTDNYDKPVPSDIQIEVTVYRTAYSLGQMNLVVAKFPNLAPGESAEFVDDIMPAWEINQEYTYRVESIAKGYTFYDGYGSIKPGIEFMFDADAISLTPQIDGTSVEIEVVVPSKMTTGAPLEEPLLSLEFYSSIDASNWRLIYQVPNPEPGTTETYLDQTAAPNTKNYFKIRAVTKYGYAETYGNCYVGLDTPAAPYPVKAVEEADGVHISWTVPDRGENWGVINPAEIWYNVFRCRGYGAENRELIASQITETSFIDRGEGITTALEVRYEVQSGNSRGLGGSNFSSSDYDIVVGPAYTLPFRDTFDGGFTKVWKLTHSDYFTDWYQATIGEYGSKPERVSPIQGSGLVYVDYVYNSPASGSTNTLTSYKLDLKDMKNPWVSFWYYAIPDNDVTISFASSADGTEFENPHTVRISENVTKPEWRKAWLPIENVSESGIGYIRFTTSFTSKPSSAILDDVAVMNYPGVDDLEVKIEEESMSVSIEWSLPTDGAAACTGFEGYVNGEKYGEVTSPWTYENMEYDVTYTFQVKPLYEGVDVDASPVRAAMIKSPAVTEFTVGDYDYSVMVTEEADDAAEVNEVAICGYHGEGGLLRMPATVTFKDTEYKVCGVVEEAFSGNAKIESVAMPEGYTFILREAFRGAVSLEYLSIPASMLNIGEMAFEGCSALSMVNFAGSVPPSVGQDAFAGIAEGCKGLCPEDAKKDYASVENLKTIDFGYKEEGPDAVVSIITDGDSVVEYFDLQGLRISEPSRGKAHIIRITYPDGSIRTEKRF